MEGVIFDIKEFAIYDGPGIRQTVFMKGCPLRCNWCHNPEGLCREPQLLVHKTACTHCGACSQVCGRETCTACGNCIPVCPLRLRRIAGEAIDAEALADRIKKNGSYYAAYGGGVTFSGGEPLLQDAFLVEVLKRLDGMHRAIETSGYCSKERFFVVCQHVELVMMDLKLMNPGQHKKYTGVDNLCILENAAALCEGTVPFVIRVPLIPNINDNVENYRQTAAFLAGAEALQKVELLPYHQTAGAKYGMTGRTYTPLFDPEKPVNVMQEIFTEYGIRSEVL